MLSTRKKAFTLVELLVVISIISLLIALLLPALAKARETSKAIVCRGNLHQIYIAMAGYSADNREYIPACSTAAGNWHYRVGQGGYFGGSTPAVSGLAAILGDTWAVLKCPAEYNFQAYPTDPPGTCYTDQYIQTSYAINFTFSYYKTDVPRRGFGQSAPGCAASKLPTIMDCPAWNIGLAAAMFNWHADDQYWVWDPYYPYRHPGHVANVLYMDGHVAGAKSSVLGEGPAIYWAVYNTDPDNVTPMAGGVVYTPYPY